MRNIDVVKCWPFGGPSSDDGDGESSSSSNSKIKKETMESLLPPITVTKFRWWSEELDRLKSTELASSSNTEKEKHKFEETQPRIQSSDLLQVEEKSDERLDMLECPVCGVFAASTVNALNAHVDSCLSQASREERRQMRMAIKV
ncbi:putative Zinc finger, Rad18-type [Corchorus olitorius]|uniref:Zinc finger, Rad18-type n=1 Tax=Corchorus olitorius TaxID=93759 RepID=A0A1R3GRW6_9ROSI|nr:putative Zinc finger, Rad18-type [Corchorus olitorius]